MVNVYFYIPHLFHSWEVGSLSLLLKTSSRPSLSYLTKPDEMHTMWAKFTPTPACCQTSGSQSLSSFIKGIVTEFSSPLYPNSCHWCGWLNVNKHQIPWSLRFFSLLTTKGLLHHSNMAITPVTCSRQSYPFTSKIINSNILFSDCILLSFERVQVFQPWSFWLSWDHMCVSPLLSPSPLTRL